MVHLQSPQFSALKRHRSFVRRLKILCGCCLLFSALAAPAIAQVAGSVEAAPTDQILSSYEGQNVSSIDIAGRPDLNAQQFATAFVQQAGKPIRTGHVQSDSERIESSRKVRGSES
jgi:hypothetical protein